MFEVKDKHSRFPCKFWLLSILQLDIFQQWDFNFQVYLKRGKACFNLLQDSLVHGKSPYSVQIRENTDQKKLRISTFFTQW